MPKKKFNISKEFVDQVLSIIADESDEGRKKLISISETAEKRYDRPVKSWITGWVYQYTRTRGGKVKQSIQLMEDFKDAYTRLQEFQLMISDGKWNVGSYNHYLFLGLIDAIPDYEPLDEALVHLFVLQLKELVIAQIDSFMAQYKAVLEEKKRREIERQATRQTARQEIDNVLIFNNLASAKAAAAEQQDKIIFCLHSQNSQWKLTWFDEADIMYSLELVDELAQKLATLSAEDIEQLKPVNLKRIKRECIKAKELYLSKVQLLIDQVLTPEQLAAKGNASTFVLRLTENETSLSWINSISKVSAIGLKNYPQISAWLATHKSPLSEAEVLQFKAYLLQVKTTQSIAADKLQSLDGLLAKVFHKQDKSRQADALDARVEKQALKIQLHINPEDTKTNVALTPEQLAAKGANSTFVLRLTADEKSLWWINSLGQVNAITLKDYPQIIALLSNHHDPLSEDDVLQLKTHLVQVNTAQPITGEKLNLLNGLLSKVFQKQDEPDTVKKAVSEQLLQAPVAEEQVAKVPRKKLAASSYAALGELPIFWQQRKSEVEMQEALGTDIVKLSH